MTIWIPLEKLQKVPSDIIQKSAKCESNLCVSQTNLIQPRSKLITNCPLSLKKKSRSYKYYKREAMFLVRIRIKFGRLDPDPGGQKMIYTNRKK